MRALRILCGGILCLLIGCAMFPQRSSSLYSTNNVSADDLQQLSPGDWYRVQLVEVHDGFNSIQTEYIGMVSQVDGESLSITDATRNRRIEDTFPYIPPFGRLLKNTSISRVDATVVVLSRDQIAMLTKISPQRAQELQQPYERIGIDFNFQVREVRRPDASDSGSQTEHD